METILVPTDFSENANNALHYAATIASQVQARLIIAHIINLPIAPLENGIILDPDPQLEEDFQQELEKLAKGIQQKYDSSLKIETICQYGYLLSDLNDIVKAKAVDLVVMGTKGATNFLDKLIGTNTSEFVKVAICPVLTIPSIAKFAGIQHIAYASDFETDENLALTQLFRLAQPFGARVTIINILTEEELNIVSDRQILEAIAHQFPDSNFSIAQIKEANIIHGLHAFAEDNNADILATSMHKRSFFDDLFHKSVSKRLIYHTTLPLLLLPENPYRKPHLRERHQQETQ